MKNGMVSIEKENTNAKTDISKVTSVAKPY
jgi:hypothetical protein